LVIISELSSSRSRKRLVACVAGFKTLEFICAVVVAETKVDLAVKEAVIILK
jgi:1-deoxy-D-xylulose 5-phosphate reductoisomerase